MKIIHMTIDGSFEIKKEDLKKFPKDIELHIFTPDNSCSNNDGSTTIIDKNGER